MLVKTKKNVYETNYYIYIDVLHFFKLRLDLIDLWIQLEIPNLVINIYRKYYYSKYLHVVFLINMVLLMFYRLWILKLFFCPQLWLWST